ncbi:MAG: hypothetical protein J4F36_14510, partial [Nitrosopumilaceae archaeon]|nr:hypothetical protein [Nitrosopumilaceae archaeon]
GNETGHWESKLILALNDKILQLIGSSWNDWKTLDQAYLESSSMNQLREEALDILEKEYSSSQLFIIKDPRICRLLPFWLDVLKHFNAKPLIILPIRNPLDVAASLKARDKIDSSISLLIWLRHILDAEFYSRGLKRTYLRFEDLLVKPQTIVNRISEVLEINWPKQYSSSINIEIKKFLQFKLHHHHTNDVDVYNNRKLSQWICLSFEILNKWSYENIILTDKDKLDQIRTAFNEATLAFNWSVYGQIPLTEKNKLEQKILKYQSQINKTDQLISQTN